MNIEIKVEKSICFIKKAQKTTCLKLFDKNNKFLSRKELTEKFILQEYNNEEIAYILSKIMQNVECSNEILVYEKYFAHLNLDYDDVYILSSNIGESAIFLRYFAKVFIKMNGSKKPLFIAGKKYLIDLVNLFFPKAKCLFMDLYLKEPLLEALGLKWKYNNHNFYYIFPQSHYHNINSEIGKIHFIEQMYKTLDIDKNVIKNITDFHIKKTSKNKIITKFEKLNIDLDNLIILAPEASTFKELSPSFWISLKVYLENLGYTVIINCKEPKKYNYNNISDFSVEEIFVLSNMAKCIISLRSGLVDLLTALDTPLICISTFIPWSPATSQKCIDAYSIMKMPFKDYSKTREINASHIGNEDLLMSEVLRLFKEIC